MRINHRMLNVGKQAKTPNGARLVTSINLKAFRRDAFPSLSPSLLPSTPTAWVFFLCYFRASVHLVALYTSLQLHIITMTSFVYKRGEFLRGTPSIRTLLADTPSRRWVRDTCTSLSRSSITPSRVLSGVRNASNLTRCARSVSRLTYLPIHEK
jgi:hypothetical protein